MDSGNECHFQPVMLVPSLVNAHLLMNTGCRPVRFTGRTPLFTVVEADGRATVVVHGSADLVAVDGLRLSDGEARQPDAVAAVTASAMQRRMLDVVHGIRTALRTCFAGSGVWVDLQAELLADDLALAAHDAGVATIQSPFGVAGGRILTRSCASYGISPSPISCSVLGSALASR